MQADTDVDTFLARLPDDQRAALQSLRETIRAAVPDAVEAISYGVPAFKLHGRPLLSYGAAKNHCAFYVQSPAVMEAHAAELEGLPQGRGSIRFQPDEPLPADLVTALVKARIAETTTNRREG
jgi:uncharacterized protein YdhG (YjbR/CyaY superfamily)